MSTIHLSTHTIIFQSPNRITRHEIWTHILTCSKLPKLSSLSSIVTYVAKYYWKTSQRSQKWCILNQASEILVMWDHFQKKAHVWDPDFLARTMYVAFLSQFQKKKSKNSESSNGEFELEQTSSILTLKNPKTKSKCVLCNSIIAEL